MKRVAVILVSLGLVVGSVGSAGAHTTSHPHTCTSSAHGWQTDGFPNQHNATVTLTPVAGGGFTRKVTVTHQTFWSGSWHTHANPSYSCFVF